MPSKLTITSEYKIWIRMRRRALYVSTERENRDYLSRGITVCDRWAQSFRAFRDDMGPRPSTEHSLDRIDNNGNYEPGNVRWATRKQQVRNRRVTPILEYRGARRAITEWVEILGLDYERVKARLQIGWSVVDAFERPARVYVKHGLRRRREM